MRREAWLLECDRADLLRACGDAEAVDLWPVLVAAWEKIPARDRRRLRGRFTLRIMAGAGAHVGVPVASAAVGLPEIVLGREVADVPATFAHELAHVFLGHCNTAEYSGPAVVAAWSVPASAVAVAVADKIGRIRAGLTKAEAAMERAAWAVTARWGFDVPERWRGG